jgi:hypothetical protein
MSQSLHERHTMSNIELLYTSISKEGWRKQAACIGKHDLFTLAEAATPNSPDRGSRNTVGLSIVEVRELNRSNFEVAEEICLNCPVMQQCNAAIPQDSETRRWSYVAGEQPQVDTNYGEVVGKKCPNRHADYLGDACKACERAAAWKAARIVTGETRTCVRGHEYMIGDKCLPCRRMRAEEVKKYGKGAPSYHTDGSLLPEPAGRLGEDRICNRGHVAIVGKACQECKNLNHRTQYSEKNEGHTPRYGNVAGDHRKCVRGHDTLVGSNCLECRAHHRKTALERLRENIPAITHAAPGEDRTCKRGHASVGGERCKICKAMKRKGEV